MQFKKVFVFIIFTLFLDFDVFAQAPAQEDFPLLMFVTARAGLRVRRAVSPSVNSEIVRTLSYRSFIQVFGRQDNPVTIDGITDYWYRLSAFPFNNTFEWIFGGFLSRELPEDLPVVIGKWLIRENPRMYMTFYPNYRFRHGWREASEGITGTWSINGNTITLVLVTFPNPIGDWGTGEAVIVTVYAQLDITDRDNIRLSFSQEMMGLGYASLTRNRRGW